MYGFYTYGIKCLNCAVLVFLFDKLHFTIFNTFCITSIMDFTVKASGVIFLCQTNVFFFYL